MSLTPLLAAPALTVAHVAAALAALIVGAVLFAGVKGARLHRALGWCWVALMGFVAASSLGISGIREFGRFSAIHLLSLFVLGMLPVAVLHARRHNRFAHGWSMFALYLGGLVIAGGFTLLPGRLMGAVVFGAP